MVHKYGYHTVQVPNFLLKKKKITCELHNSDLRIELLKKRLLGSWHHSIKMRLKKLKLLSQKYPLKTNEIHHELNATFGMPLYFCSTTVKIFGNDV